MGADDVAAVSPASIAVIVGVEVPPRVRVVRAGAGKSGGRVSPERSAADNGADAGLGSLATTGFLVRLPEFIGAANQPHRQEDG